MSNDNINDRRSNGIQAELSALGVNAPEVLNRLMEILEISKDVDLAARLSVSKATISNWKSRNKIPYEFIVMLYLKEDIDIVYCLTGNKVGMLSGYPAYHAGVEMAALFENMRSKYGPPENWRLERGTLTKKQDDTGDQ